MTYQEITTCISLGITFLSVCAVIATVYIQGEISRKLHAFTCKQAIYGEFIGMLLTLQTREKTEEDIKNLITKTGSIYLLANPKTTAIMHDVIRLLETDDETIRSATNELINAFKEEIENTK